MSGCYDCCCLFLLVPDSAIVMALAMTKMKAAVSKNNEHVIMAVMTVMKMMVMAVILMLGREDNESGTEWKLLQLFLASIVVVGFGTYNTTSI